MAEAPEAEIAVRLALPGLGTVEKAVKLSEIKPDSTR